MKKLTHSLPAKAAAIFLFVIAALITFWGAAGLYLLGEYNFYQLPEADIKKGIFENITRSYANTVFYEYFPAYRNDSYSLKEYQAAFSPENTNFLFVLKDSDGNIILNTYSNEQYLISRTYEYEEYIVTYDETDSPVTTLHRYTIDCFVKKTMTANDRYSIAEYWFNLTYKIRYVLIPVTIISLLSAVILFVFLMCSAGRRKGEDKVMPNGIDKIPLDILFSVLLLIVVGQYSLFASFDFMSTAGMIIIITLFITVIILLGLLACMTFATRYKLGGWWKNTIIYRLCSLIFKIISKVFNGSKYIFLNIPLIGKTIFVILAISFVEFIILVSTYDRSTLALLWFIEKVVFVPSILFLAIGLRKLQTAGRKIAAGDLGYRVDTRYLFWDFKSHGENLNSISEGISKAVDERMKSERFKTELITNVSHDIKTPLTSIINYVDLIKKEDIENDTLKEYVNVLDRQSGRLKKLIEDLVEASKASTGNMEVNWAKTEIGVLLTQTAGEYEEKLKENGIELILKKPEEEVFVSADGRLLWRVFDNLMNNICKYAQPSTRAYINLDITDNKAIITFRNISKYSLNISSDELLERFIRGDSSRSTEGSGLGLSIAKSLTELQHGALDLYVDGDLFKVIISFSIL